MRLLDFRESTARRFRRPSTWGAIVVFGLVWALVRLAAGQPFGRLGIGEFLIPALLAAGHLALSPMPWQWTDDQRKVAPLWRGCLQALPWNAAWLALLLLLIHGLFPKEPPPAPGAASHPKPGSSLFASLREALGSPPGVGSTDPLGFALLLQPLPPRGTPPPGRRPPPGGAPRPEGQPPTDTAPSEGTPPPAEPAPQTPKTPEPAPRVQEPLPPSAYPSQATPQIAPQEAPVPAPASQPRRASGAPPRLVDLVPAPSPELMLFLLNLPFAMILGWFLAEKERAEAAEAELVELARQAQAKALQAQLHPHALYNVLGGLTELVHEDPDAAEEALVGLVEMLRMLTRQGAATELPLSQERALVKHYLAIEEIRLGPRLQVKWTWPEWADALKLPPLLLQPLVENAIKHGISPCPEGGTLRIGVSRTDRDLVLRVANTGQPFDPKAAEGTGLRNLRERLALLPQLDASLELRWEEGWALAELRLRTTLGA